MGIRQIGIAAVLVGLVLSSGNADAALNSAQRRELLSLQRELSKVASMVLRKDVEGAEKLLTETQKKIDEIVKEAKAEDDRLVKTLRQTIERHEKKLSALKGEDPAKPEDGEAGGMSFKDDVRPILAKYCGGCHIDNGRGGLRLGSAAAAVQGGQKGPAVVPGNPNGSLMLRRIAAGEMPPGNRPKPNQQEIAVLVKWIADGAKEGGPTKKLPKVDVPKPTGNETVSFKEDIAPFMVNLCVGCHSGNNPRGGLNLTTVRNMMLGGDTGMVVLPGDLENSRMYLLVSGKEAPVMPQGQARLTRKNFDDFTQWFKEGNKIDIDDPDKLLREVVPTPAELLARELAALTPEEFSQRRLQRSHDAWSRALPNQGYRIYETRDFAVLGNVPGERLREVGDWAEEQAATLRDMFGQKADEELWKGRLAIIVLKDRYEFGEFNLIIERRESPAEMTGYSRVTSNGQDAYTVLLDVGDESSVASPGMRVSVISQIVGAYLARGEGQLPEWLKRGTGLVIASQSIEDDPYLQGLKKAAQTPLQRLTKPADVFADGQFSPTEVGPVGYALVDFLIKGGTKRKFGEFIRALQSGASVTNAIQSVYRATPQQLAVNFFATFR